MHAYGKQPQIAQWNLSRLAGAISALFSDHEPLHVGLKHYNDVFNAQHREINASKFGLLDATEQDLELIQDAFRLMHVMQLDMTLFFRNLADHDLSLAAVMTFESCFYNAELRNEYAAEFEAWLQTYAERISTQKDTHAARRERMNAINPLYVPRNWLAQQAIDAAEQGDLEELHTLMDVLKNPYQIQKGRERFALRRPEWASNRAGCSMLSCSS
jgi:serine/tyrosine/threonine adenylyltransferase